MSDIIERLRKRAEEEYEMLDNIHEPLLEAADTIEVLRAENAKLQHVLKLALEYWAHRQQRYKNRHPAWVIVARAMMEDAE